MTTAARLRALASLVEARKARDLAQLDSLMAEDRRLAAEMDDLARTPTRDAAEGGTALPHDRQAARLTWMERRMTALAEARAALRTPIAAARAAAIQSLGKNEALDHLVDRETRAAAQRRAARAEREAPPAKAPKGF